MLPHIHLYSSSVHTVELTMAVNNALNYTLKQAFGNGHCQGMHEDDLRPLMGTSVNITATNL